MSQALPFFVRHRVAPRAGQRGISLLEALVAFAILAGSTVAATHLQADFHLDADVARQRSEAVRLGAAAMEHMRAFSVIADAPGARSFDGLGTAEAIVDAASGDASNASYRVVRSADAGALTGAKAAAVQVGWADRSGRYRSVTLASFIAGADPAYAGALSVGSGTVPTATRSAFGRSPAVPLEARDLGDGTSAWRPRLSGDAGYVFDNAGGDVVARCSHVGASGASGSDRDSAATLPSGCTAGRWRLVGGTIRFTSAVPAAATAASETPLALTVDLVREAGDAGPAPICSAEPRRTQRVVRGGSLHIESVALDASVPPVAPHAATPADDRFIAWSCLVAPRDDGGLSSRVALVPTGWRIGGGSGERRVCRYADAGPARVAENFLVLPADQPCPHGTLS